MPIKTISSAHNNDLKDLSRLLQNARDRRKSGLMVLEGIHLATASLEAGGELTALYINAEASAHPEIVQLVASVGERVAVSYITPGVFAKVTALTSAPELLALARRPVPERPAAHVSRLLLEDIQDPGNLGTILRSAAASGVNEVFLSKGCVDVYSPKVLRAGMGAHFVLNLHEAADLEAVLNDFNGSKLVTALDGAVSLYSQDLTGPVAFVFGNEGSGVSTALQALAPARIKIPMPGQAESLNVAMAATVCLFERVRQLEAQAG
ncbi:RNA methyltransferase [Crenobacter sp. SG2303]|uniref:RNA methyltransferase n=1 Tax=Crenobacter oryzisoli TaxID=3056844 RepID=A0ABT7XNT2_9NEIS|nr:RNA methyltransferase [Crenobacter sp. SG2303]MDN0075449.1 RNA methyltransferase [Crenobacter sp. SG2303]